ncbi:MAG: hypothetical protein LBF61_11205 [Azoarcus sp.]|nr:hypothetical protein [Azoarcus sp.]
MAQWQGRGRGGRSILGHLIRASSCGCVFDVLPGAFAAFIDGRAKGRTVIHILEPPSHAGWMP